MTIEVSPRDGTKILCAVEISDLQATVFDWLTRAPIHCLPSFPVVELSSFDFRFRQLPVRLEVRFGRVDAAAR